MLDTRTDETTERLTSEEIESEITTEDLKKRNSRLVETKNVTGELPRQDSRLADISEDRETCLGRFPAYLQRSTRRTEEKPDRRFAGCAFERQADNCEIDINDDAQFRNEVTEVRLASGRNKLDNDVKEYRGNAEAEFVEGKLTGLTSERKYSKTEIRNIITNGNEVIVNEDGAEENEEIRSVSFNERKNYSKKSCDRSPEKVSIYSKEDPGIRSAEEENYAGRTLGTSRERGTNYTEEKSLIHSRKNATQSSNEEGKDFGTLPDASILKNVCDAVAAVSPRSKSPGKEEGDLNATIRRMIITELKKHRERVKVSVNRAHSDEQNVTEEKPDWGKSQPISINRAPPRNLKRASDNLSERHEDRSANEQFVGIGFSGSTKISVGIAGKNLLHESYRGTNRDASRSKNFPEINSGAISCLDDGDGSETNNRRPADVTYLPRSSVSLAKTVETTNGLLSEKPERSCKSTQTEHIYVIRAARSCQFEKKRKPLHLLQLYRLTASRNGGVSSRTVYTTRDFSEFIFRKSSDNLIYEKGKASGSPSYIPASERFRWRYVTPRKKDVYQNTKRH